MMVMDKIKMRSTVDGKRHLKVHLNLMLKKYRKVVSNKTIKMKIMIMVNRLAMKGILKMPIKLQNNGQKNSGHRKMT